MIILIDNVCQSIMILNKYEMKTRQTNCLRLTEFCYKHPLHILLTQTLSKCSSTWIHQLCLSMSQKGVFYHTAFRFSQCLQSIYQEKEQFALCTYGVAEECVENDNPDCLKHRPYDHGFMLSLESSCVLFGCWPRAQWHSSMLGGWRLFFHFQLCHQEVDLLMKWKCLATPGGLVAFNMLREGEKTENKKFNSNSNLCI